MTPDLKLENIFVSPFSGAVAWEPLTPLDERIESLYGQARSPEVRSLAETVLGRVDRKAHEALQRKYDAEIRKRDVLAEYKYLDVAFWAMKAAWYAHCLKYHVPGKAPKRALDLGAGACFVSATLRELGSDAVATDITNPLYDDIAALIDIERHYLKVEPLTPLPETFGVFDLVTAFAPNFDKFPAPHNSKATAWTREEWRFFLRDIFEERMKGGRFVTILNRDAKGGKPGDAYDGYPKDFIEFARELGAEEALPAYIIKNTPAQRKQLTAGDKAARPRAGKRAQAS